VSRRLILPAVAAMALILPAPASAIVNGTPAAQGAHPAHGFLGIDTDANGFVDSFCSGTLVGSRQFLTAARCTTNVLGLPRQPSSLTVRIGDINLPDSTVVQNVATNDIPEPTELPPDGYVKPTGKNDVAMLTLTAPVDTDLVRVVDATETAAWAPGTAGTVLGWGEIEGGDISETLLTGDVVRRADADCPNPNFDPAVMLCAAGTPATGDENPCPSDSGSPLLLPDGTGFALAGVFSGATCATADAPGIFARVGADPLNAWVHQRTPQADFDLSHQPRAGEPVTLFSTSRHPEGAGHFTTFKWNFDGDNDFDDREGASITATFPTPGDAVVGLEVSKPGGDTASVYYLFKVMPAPAATGGTTTPTTPPRPTTNPVVRTPLATILASGRPRVRGRRFPIRVRFARTAPRGTAVIEVYRGTRRIGIARTRVRRGATKRVNVTLTPTGRQRLARAVNRRMRVRVRVRVGRRVLTTRRLTIQRLR